MKKILIPIFMFSALSAYAQGVTKEDEETDSIAVELVELPKSTAIGAADGKLVAIKIGPSGGKIISVDGRVELIFPEGALKETTSISIQPIVNLVPNGSGKAYRFEPSGIRFNKPVELIFHYSKEDEATCPPLLMFMALQSDNGKWEYMDYEDWDSTNRTLKGSLLHFSQMVNGNQVRLSEEEVTLKVGKKHNFKLFIVNPPDPAPGSPDEDELFALPNIAPLGNELTQWKVNGYVGGSAKFGWIKALKDPATARYTAPTNMIKDDFITVEVKTYIVINDDKVGKATKKKGKMITFKSKREYLASLSCKVRLYDEYKITVKVQGKSIMDCDAELADSSNYNVKIFPNKVLFSNLSNRPPVVTRQAKCKPYYPLKYVATGCLGPVHVNTSMLEKYEMSANSPSDITIEFTPLDVSVIKATGKFKEEIREYPHADLDVNVGNSIKFKANRKIQTTNVRGEHGYSVIVSPI